ncbi:MAG TPA: flavin reductase family protein [Gemmatimonadaceae bacterium]|nr:flavin reductase family protein [Gemmatimonadaceae bacterium]
MTLDPDTFRSVLGRFASGVTVVTVRDPDNHDCGMTVSAFCSVSLTPPLVLICIDHAASSHDALLAASHFAVNVLGAHQEPISRRFSGGEDETRFGGVGYTRGVSGAALLDDALAHIECRRVEQHPAGDHTIVIGEVEAAVAHSHRPLLYYRGGYAQLER